MAKTDQKGPEVSSPSSAVAAAVANPEKDQLVAYYCGLTESCPLDFITVPTLSHEGAPSFQKFTQKLQDRGDGISTLTERQAGGFLKLFPDEVEAIKKYIEDHGILWLCKVPGEIRVEIVTLQGDKTFKRSRREDVSGNIEPLSKYMFMTKAKAMSAEDREANNLPPTLLEEKSLASK